MRHNRTAILLLLVASVSHAQDANPSEREMIQQLVQQVKALQEKVEALESQKYTIPSGSLRGEPWHYTLGNGTATFRKKRQPRGTRSGEPWKKTKTGIAIWLSTAKTCCASTTLKADSCRSIPFQRACWVTA